MYKGCRNEFLEDGNEDNLKACLYASDTFNVDGIPMQELSRCGKDIPYKTCIMVSNIPGSTFGKDEVAGRPDASDYTYAAFKAFKGSNDKYLEHNVSFSVFALENAKTATGGAFCTGDDCPKNKVVQTPWYIGYEEGVDTGDHGGVDPTFSQDESTKIWTQFNTDLNTFLETNQD